MSYVLTSGDLDQTARAVQLLVSPLDHPSIDAWRAAVNAYLGKVLHADTAGFLLPVGGGPLIYSDDHDAAALAAYPDYPPPPAARGRPAWEEMVWQRVATLESLYAPDVDRYVDSAYYNEYAGANDAHDTLALSITTGRMDIHEMASLQFWHSRPDGRRFGDREIAILRLVLPAFRAGARTALGTLSNRAALMTNLDAQRDGALLFDLAGRLVHRNPAMGALVLTAGDERALIATARGMACGLADENPVLSAGPCHGRMRTAAGDLELRALRFSEGLLGSGPSVLVTVEPRAAAPPPRKALRDAFGLTKRQAEVALLLDRRKSNAEIARILGISPHTARRHTEAVMGKLSVTDRREIRPRLRQLDEDPDADVATVAV